MGVVVSRWVVFTKQPERIVTQEDGTILGLSAEGVEVGTNLSAWTPVEGVTWRVLPLKDSQ